MLKHISLFFLAFISVSIGAETDLIEDGCVGIIEFLVSDRADENLRGKILLEQHRTSIIQELIEKLNSDQLLNDRKMAARHLALICSPWARAKEANTRSCGQTRFVAPVRPVERPKDIDEIEVIREGLQQAVEDLLAETKGEYMTGFQSSALKTYCKSLDEFADDETVDWAIQMLKGIDSVHQGQPFHDLVNSYLGLRRESHIVGVCGNTSPKVLEKIKKAQNNDYLVATSDLETLWTKMRSQNHEQRLDYAINSWRDYFIPRQESYSGHIHSNEWLCIELEALVRQGTPALEQLRDMKYKEATVEAKAFWEVVIATINGHPSSSMLDSLFRGKSAHLEMACEIVVASGSKKWLEQLTPLQYKSGFNSKMASNAISSVHRYEGLDALRKGFELNPNNYTAKYAILELEERMKSGPPRGIRYY